MMAITVEQAKAAFREAMAADYADVPPREELADLPEPDPARREQLLAIVAETT